MSPEKVALRRVGGDRLARGDQRHQRDRRERAQGQTAGPALASPSLTSLPNLGAVRDWVARLDAGRHHDRRYMRRSSAVAALTTSRADGALSTTWCAGSARRLRRSRARGSWVGGPGVGHDPDLVTVARCAAEGEASGAGDGLDIEDLLEAGAELQGRDGVAGRELDDPDAALELVVVLRDGGSAEDGGLADLREPHEGQTVVDREAAGVARQDRDHLTSARGEV